MKGSVLTNDLGHCFICGRTNPEIHHIFFGTSNREISGKLGYVIPLCTEDHRGNRGVHHNRPFDYMLKCFAQQHFEQNIGNRDEFRKRFGKSYL
jgi:uncharacterized protein YifN (PemK superfamily)